MRVYFDNLFADFAHVSLNKKKRIVVWRFLHHGRKRV